MAMRWVWLRCCLVTVSIVVFRDTPVSSHTMYEHVTHKYNYNRDVNDMLGVYNWPRTFSSDCAGAHQSPVDIRTDRVVYRQHLRCPLMVYQNTQVSGTLKNNGHSVAFELHHATDVRLYNVPYRHGSYYLHDFHVHFHVAERSFPFTGLGIRGGKVMSHVGSEHTMDGLQFDGEVHFVFYNSMYMDRGDDQADDKPNGMVVVSIMVQKLAPGVPADSAQTAVVSDFMERQIPRVFPLKMNASASVDLSMFLGSPCEFYTYPGSLTTPRCHEVVRWLIMRQPVRVTDSAWSQLTGLQMEDMHAGIFGNLRPTQPINDRLIETNFPPRNSSRVASLIVQRDNTLVTQPVPMMSTQVIRNNNPTHLVPNLLRGPNSLTYACLVNGRILNLTLAQLVNIGSGKQKRTISYA